MRFASLPALVSVVALIVLGEGAAARQTGVIRGRVTVPQTAARERPNIADASAAHHAPVDRRRVVVYLESAPRQAFDEIPTVRARMDQRNEQFVPRVLAITTGTIVDFPNSDKTFHNVFSLSRVRTFDLGRFRPGRSGAVRFERPGIVPVFCDIHTHMSAYILVFSHPFFAVSDEAGRYEIAGIPAGTYDLAVWSEVGTAPSRRITVPESGMAEADFQVARR